MLFNSYTFVFGFLPAVMLVFYALAVRVPRRVAMLWLVAASLFYYGWSRPENLLLIGALLVANYGAGTFLGRNGGTRLGRLVLAAGIAANLGVLGYFKYTNFLVDTVNTLTGGAWPAANIILPLGLSFFTFQKIAYLVDAYRGKTRGYNFIDYCLFVTFFPQLIAGPIVHHSEVIPQFSDRKDYRPNAEDFSVGLTQFICGLFKKVVIADRMALYATPIFDAAAAGAAPSFLDGWIAALAYSFQLYFDFSGYSDMALGLGRLFGIRLPLNFNSPYKAANITEFWRRWHMTLSRFLRDYLYIPLGGNRRGPVRRYSNLMLTMLLGGLWHGAGWNFVIWGGLHGLYLVLHHAWRTIRGGSESEKPPPGFVGLIGRRALTFLAVLLAWIFFRAANMGAAKQMLASMFGLAGLDLRCSFDLGNTLPALGAVALVVWLLPNTQEWLGRFRPALDYEEPAAASGGVAVPTRMARFSWRPAWPWALAVGGFALFTLTQLSRVSEFIYWQF